jgi:Protein of unknown function (DUF3106)
MNRHRPIPVLLALVLASGLSLAGGADAQSRDAETAAYRQQIRREEQNVKPVRAQNQPNVQPKPGERRMLGLPQKWVERLQDMTPEQQERFMRNNARFNSLPPQQQEQIRRRLEVWNNLTPQQQQEIRERQQVWEQLTPEQQGYVRNVLLPRWQLLPPQRKAVILQHLRSLNNLSDADREARLNDPAFNQGLSPDEQHMLRDLAHLRVGGTIEGPPQ